MTKLCRICDKVWWAWTEEDLPISGRGRRQDATSGARFLLRRLHFDLQLAQLTRTDRGRRIRHQVGPFGGFRKGNDVPDTRRTAQDRDQAIETERDSAVRRGAVAKR